MIGLIITIVLIFVGLYLIFSERDIEFGLFMSAICVVALIAQIFLISEKRHSINVTMFKRQAFIKTLEHSRTRGYDLEDAGILHEISKWNQWVVGVQKDNEFWRDTYIPDTVDTLTQIK